MLIVVELFPRARLCACMPPIRLVLFDALYTLVRPRKPIAAQYAQVLSSHLGLVRRADVEKSFPTGQLNCSQSVESPLVH